MSGVAATGRWIRLRLELKLMLMPDNVIYPTDGSNHTLDMVLHAPRSTHHHIAIPCIAWYGWYARARTREDDGVVRRGRGGRRHVPQQEHTKEAQRSRTSTTQRWTEELTVVAPLLPFHRACFPAVFCPVLSFSFIHSSPRSPLPDAFFSLSPAHSCMSSSSSPLSIRIVNAFTVLHRHRDTASKLHISTHHNLATTNSGGTTNNAHKGRHMATHPSDTTHTRRVACMGGCTTATHLSLSCTRIRCRGITRDASYRLLACALSHSASSSCILVHPHRSSYRPYRFTCTWRMADMSNTSV